MMLKPTSILWEFPTIHSLLTTLECKRNIHMTSLLKRWYVPFLRAPRVYNPSKKPLIYADDWENEPYKPKDRNEYIPFVKSLKDFQSLDERCKNLFTYSFAYKKQEYDENTIKTFEELGIEPTDDSLAAQVIRMTLGLRYRKWRLNEHPRCFTLRRATKCLMKARWRTLRLLRATNLSEFNRITAALKITGYQHIDPYKLGTNDPVVQRKLSVRKECYQRRLGKLAVFKTKLFASEEEFYKRKNALLSSLLTDVTLLIDPDSPDRKHKAESFMKQLFNEVVEERKLDVLKEPEDDRFAWYTKEADERERYMIQQARKLEKQQRKTRK
ncbi:hypothetical protein MN116_008038 [Schistosoma mekongi]|uniref:28S ribosomal protein S15, mitochondrial n=1 Tax=Schistosoma mekongi TaxID=38744 RepID=A0AAE1Z7A0_SCHME|nr:hypothetical protein MN116_008038 [Schistosoma mekongi]